MLQVNIMNLFVLNGGKFGCSENFKALNGLS